MALLQAKNLSWKPADAEEFIWKDVSFELSPGELVVLEGPSGSGKSTLLKAIVGLIEVSSGKRLWRGDKITADNIRRFRNEVVYVHQTPVAIAPRIADNLSFPREIAAEFVDGAQPMSEDEQERMLERLQLGALDRSRRFDELSVGERQRVAFVRCITVRPQVLLLDEPTASLDPDSAHSVEKCVLDYLDASSDRAAIWISHSKEQRERLGGRLLDLTRWNPGPSAGEYRP